MVGGEVRVFEEHERGTEGRCFRRVSDHRSLKNSISRARSSTDSIIDTFSPPDLVLIPTIRTKD